MYDTLKTAAASAPFSTYARPLLASNVLLGREPETPMQDRWPAILITVPDETNAWSAENWEALRATHGGEFPILIQIACHPPADSVYVYGKSGTGAVVGILTIVADVMNALENATNGLRLGGNALGIRTEWRMFSVSGSNLHHAAIAVMAQLRFSAGQR